ncbi:uncharacterized protein LOC134252239 [Saccostrea cucullata]|uniref:uncharacterized protein LOC134252239 n=1 Tax=Saccostrea cuccullata TaxID=36930 RepID=UPI002ED3620B
MKILTSYAPLVWLIISLTSASGFDAGVSKEDFLALKTLVVLQNDIIRKNEKELALQRKVIEELQNERQILGQLATEVRNAAKHMSYLDHLCNNTMVSNGHLIEKRIPISETIAFHVCFDHNVEHLGTSHELAFNIVITDTHSAYEKHSGTYIAPISGIYVFSWVTPIYNGDIPFQLIVNGEVKGKTDPYGSGGITTTGVAVISLNEHDVVMIRTNPTFQPLGRIESGIYKNACFSGWKI